MGQLGVESATIIASLVFITTAVLFNVHVHRRPHHKANVKIVIELKCIETTTTKESHQFFYGKKNCCPPQLCTLCPNEVNPAQFITSLCHCECVILFVVTVCRLLVKQTRKWQSLANRHWKQFEL